MVEWPESNHQSIRRRPTGLANAERLWHRAASKNARATCQNLCAEALGVRASERSFYPD